MRIATMGDDVTDAIAQAQGLSDEVAQVAATNMEMSKANQVALDTLWMGRIRDSTNSSTSAAEIADLQAGYAADQATLDAYNQSLVAFYAPDNARVAALIQNAQVKAKADSNVEGYLADALAQAQAAEFAATYAAQVEAAQATARQVDQAAVQEAADQAARAEALRVAKAAQATELASHQATSEALASVLTSPIPKGYPTGNLPSVTMQAPVEVPSITGSISTPMLVAGLIIGGLVFRELVKK